MDADRPQFFRRELIDGEFTVGVDEKADGSFDVPRFGFVRLGLDDFQKGVSEF